MTTLQQVQSYLSKELPALLRADLHAHRLVKEADVECAAYMHMRHFLDKDANWTILARRHIPQTNRYIDLVFFHKALPSIAVEIKWGAKSIGAKDRGSLNDALTKLGVHKVYWLTCSGIGSDRQPIEKSSTEKRVFKQIVVRGNFSAEQVAEWKQKIPQFRKKMGTGSGRELMP
ncbi:MAG: hypothetical protein ACKVIH_08850 [Burkholderiales bacterium]